VYVIVHVPTPAVVGLKVPPNPEVIPVPVQRPPVIVEVKLNGELFTHVSVLGALKVGAGVFPAVIVTVVVNGV
jgi:hypothetical protein